MFAHKCIMILLILNTNYQEKQLWNLVGVCTWQPGFATHQEAEERTQKYLWLPGCGSDLGCLPNGISTRRWRKFEDSIQQHQIGRRLLFLSPAIKVLHKTILEAAFYKLQHHRRLWIGIKKKRKIYLFFWETYSLWNSGAIIWSPNNCPHYSNEYFIYLLWL